MSAHCRKLADMTYVIVNGSIFLSKVVTTNNCVDHSIDYVDGIVSVIYISYIM